MEKKKSNQITEKCSFLKLSVPFFLEKMIFNIFFTLFSIFDF